MLEDEAKNFKYNEMNATDREILERMRTILRIEALTTDPSLNLTKRQTQLLLAMEAAVTRIT